MSRAFVKEDDADGAAEPPDRLISDYPNDVTPQGMSQIVQEAERAQKALADAQVSGDRDALARASRDLRYWNARLATANVVPSNEDTSQVRFGHTVTLARDDGRQQVFRIVGEDEANPAQGTLSHASPLARALFGKSVGDTVQAGAHELDIIDIA